jgi:hypothetical protein
MKNVTSLIKSWALPDRTQERSQLTVRINFDLWAKLQALKEIYPKRSVNDMVADILHAGVDEIVEALPVYSRTMTRIEAEEAAYHEQCELSDYLGSKVTEGPGINFQFAYSRILSEKTEPESKTDEAA